LRRKDSVSALLSVSESTPLTSESLTEGVPLSIGEEPPQAASNRLAAISVSTKPFRLTLILIISCLLSALQWSGSDVPMSLVVLIGVERSVA